MKIIITEDQMDEIMKKNILFVLNKLFPDIVDINFVRRKTTICSENDKCPIGTTLNNTIIKIYLDIKQYNSDGTKRSYNERSSEFKKTYNEIKEQLEDVLSIDFDYPSLYDLYAYDKNSSMRID
jgi:hypothetical protein